MKKLKYLFLIFMSFNTLSLLAADAEDFELKSYTNVPLGFVFQYQSPYMLMLAEGDANDTKPPILYNPVNHDVLRFDLLKNANTKSLTIRQFIEQNPHPPYPQGAKDIQAEVNDSGTKYILRYTYNKLYHTAIFTAFNPTDIMAIVFQSKSDWTIPSTLEKTINSMKNIQK